MMYHVQREVGAYYRHIPQLPDTFSVDENLLFGLTESKFIENLRLFFDIMKRMYMDIEVRPEEYGLLTVDIDKVNENKEDGNLAKASWRSVKRLGDVIAAIGKHAELEGDALKVALVPAKSAFSKIEKLYLIINRLIDFGFMFSDYDGKSFDKRAAAFYITYPKSPELVRVFKAYAVSEPFHKDDPHEFYYFDYKRVSNREKLPAHCVASDLGALLDEDKGKLLIKLNSIFTDDLGLLPHYKDDSIEYYLKKKRVARFIIDFHNLNVVLILKLKDMDRYIEQIENLPQNLRAYFEKGSCRYCGFQNSTEEFCKFRINWTLNQTKFNACNFNCFNFDDPRNVDAEYFVGLMRSEYNVH